MDQHNLTRRRFIRSAAVVGAAAAVGAELAGCSSGSPEATSSSSSLPGSSSSASPTAGVPGGAESSSATSASSSTALPAYIPFDAVKPDLPSSKAGVQAAYFGFPSKFVKAAKENPAAGMDITWFGRGNSDPIVPLKKNKFWQQLNAKLGGDIRVELPPVSADFPAKLATALAGGELGDITTVYPPSPAHLPDVLEAKFQDLTEYLAGDAAKKYPNLANIATASWENCVFAGRLYAVPAASPNVGSGLYLNLGIRDHDITPPKEISDGKAFLELCQELTDSKHSHWAFGHVSEPLDVYEQMLGIPNVWDIEDGKFTYYAEFDQMQQALQLTRDMWKSGLIYPDAFSDNTSSYRMIPTGRNSLVFAPAQQPHSGVISYRPDHKDYDFVLYRLPKFEGGGWSRQHLGNGLLTMNALKKADDKKIETLLSVMDYIAAPFGSEEYQFMQYGVPGWDSSGSGSSLTLTKTGTAEIIALSLNQIARPVFALAPPLTRSDQEKLHAYQSAVIPDGRPYPLAGLYSDTDSSKGVTLAKNLSSLTNDIIAGRKPVSAWSDGVKAWRSGGGDVIRKEYEKAYAVAHS